MSDARTAILTKIARATAGRPEDNPTPAERLASPPPPLVPAIGNTQDGTRLQQFVTKATELGCTIESIAGMAEVPRAVASYLSEKSLPKRVRLPEDPELGRLDWRMADVATATGTQRDELDGAVSLTRARAGIAETGAITVTSGHDYPMSLGLLPDTHVVVLKESEIVAGYEGAWPLLRTGLGHSNQRPRGLTFIGGPSRTADIEATMVLGAHGPRALHVILVQETP